MTVTFIVRKLFTPLISDPPLGITPHFSYPFRNVNMPDVALLPLNVVSTIGVLYSRRLAILSVGSTAVQKDRGVLWIWFEIFRAEESF